jgi:pyruvate dehydrogenase E2 component (dihydrolipoamide acetyltransferase)
VRHSRGRIAGGSLLCAALLELAACSRDKPPDASPPELGRGLRGEETTTAQAPAEPAPEPAKPFVFPDDPPPPAANPVAPAEPESPTAPEGPPPRDYAGELKGLVGSPSGCLKPRAGARAPREIMVTVEAIVMESGMISRAYARSSDLDDEELACIRARLGSARMQPEVEAAPRSVSTTVSLVLQPGAAPPAAAAAPPGYDQPEPPPDLDQPEASPDFDQPETALPPMGAPGDQPAPGYGPPRPSPEQPQ